MDIEHQFQTSDKERAAAVATATKIAEYKKYPGREAVDQAEQILEQNRKWGNRVLRKAIDGLDQLRDSLIPADTLRKRLIHIFIPPMPEDPSQGVGDEMDSQFGDNSQETLSFEADKAKKVEKNEPKLLAHLARVTGWGYPLALGAVVLPLYMADLRNQEVSASSPPTALVRSVGPSVNPVTRANSTLMTTALSRPGSKAHSQENPPPLEAREIYEEDLNQAEQMIQSIVGGETADYIMAMFKNPNSPIFKNIEIDHNLGLTAEEIKEGYQKTDYRLSFPGRTDMPNQFPRFLSIIRDKNGQEVESILQFRDINGNLDLLQGGNITEIYDDKALAELSARRFGVFDQDLRWFYHPTGAKAMTYDGPYQTTYSLSRTGNVYIKHELRPTSPLEFPAPATRKM